MKQGYNCPCQLNNSGDDDHNPDMQTVTVVLNAQLISDHEIELKPVGVNCAEPFNPLTVTPRNTRLVTALNWAGDVPAPETVARFAYVINEVTQHAWIHYLNKISPFVN